MRFWFFLFYFVFEFNSEYPYSLIILPDTQYYSGYFEETFRNQINYVLACRNEENIKFVSHVGDIVNHGNRDLYQWQVARSAFEELLDNDVPHGFLPGNHDVTFYDEKDEHKIDSHFYYNITLPLNWYQNKSWFGGYFNEGFKSIPLSNTFQFLKKENILFFHIEYIYQFENQTEKDLLFQWIDRIIENYTNTNTKVFLSSHNVGGPCSNYVPEEFQKLIERHCNILALFGGHVIGCTGEYLNYHLNSCNRYVPVFVSNFQVRSHGGDGFLRHYYVIPNENKTCVYTYSPKLDKFEVDNDSFFSILNWNASQIESGCSTQRKCTKITMTPSYILFHVVIISITFFFYIYFYII